jgi:hypothetical protein
VAALGLLHLARISFCITVSSTYASRGAQVLLVQAMQITYFSIQWVTKRHYLQL